MVKREPGGYDGGVRGTRAAAPLAAPTGCPLEEMREAHFLQRQNCADMERLAETEEPMPEVAQSVIEVLGRELPLHHLDEDEDLFPLLRRRAVEEDEIAPLLDRLSAEHVAAEDLSRAIMPALERMVEGAVPAASDRTLLTLIAQADRRHLTIENAIVLPLARVRLTAADRYRLAAAMRVRHDGDTWRDLRHSKSRTQTSSG